MKSILMWIGRALLTLFALVEVFTSMVSPMPQAIVPLCIGAGILVWQGFRARAYLRQKKARGHESA